MRKVLFAFVTMAICGATAAGPAVASLPKPYAPIKISTAQRTDDGSEYVWRVFCRSGLTYSFIPASQFPLSPRFVEVDKPQTGDIAWWPQYVAIYVAQNASVISAGGYTRVAELGGEQPRFFRMRVAQGDKTAPNEAPGACERNLL